MVLRRYLISPNRPTSQALVNNKVSAAAFYLIINRHHHPLTFIGPIPWIVIYMFAPQAIRAMVSITVTLHFLAAMLTLEVFYLF